MANEGSLNVSICRNGGEQLAGHQWIMRREVGEENQELGIGTGDGIDCSAAVGRGGYGGMGGGCESEESFKLLEVGHQTRTQR